MNCVINGKIIDFFQMELEQKLREKQGLKVKGIKY
jgi:hypothetical protein